MTGQLSGPDAAAGEFRRAGRGRSAAAAAANAQRAHGDSARREVAIPLAPGTVAWISVGFAVIAATWLTLGTTGAETVMLAALLAGYVAGRLARAIALPVPSPAAAWSLAGCAVLGEFIVYAGMAGAAARHPADAGLAGPMAGPLQGTFLAGLGGAGSAGVWRLAVTAVVLAVALPLVDVCLNGPSSAPGAGAGPRRILGGPGDARLPLAGVVVLLAGVRAGFAALLVLGVAALGAIVIDGTRDERQPGDRRGYRGDGWLAVRIGGLVRGRIPPMAPLLVGLLVTGVLVPLGLRNLPGILVLTPVEAMLLAALGSWHPHDGRSDWLVPPLIQAAEYLFLAEAGFASPLWPVVTFVLVAAVGLRHLDLAYRARGGLASGRDRRGLGWEGRMIIVGIAAATGIQLVVYPALALWLCWLDIRDWAVGWSAGRGGTIA